MTDITQRDVDFANNVARKLFPDKGSFYLDLEGTLTSDNYDFLIEVSKCNCCKKETELYFVSEIVTTGGNYEEPPVTDVIPGPHFDHFEDALNSMLCHQFNLEVANTIRACYESREYQEVCEPKANKLIDEV